MAPTIVVITLDFLHLMYVLPIPQATTVGAASHLFNNRFGPSHSLFVLNQCNITATAVVHLPVGSTSAQ